jgi:hypothetical protein
MNGKMLATEVPSVRHIASDRRSPCRHGWPPNRLEALGDYFQNHIHTLCVTLRSDPAFLIR